MAQDKTNQDSPRTPRGSAPRQRRDKTPSETRNRDVVKDTPTEVENPEWWRGDPGRRGEVL